MVERAGVGERHALGFRFEEKIEGIEDRHFGHEIDFHFERLVFFRENEAGEVVGLGVLLPIDEVFFRADAQGVAQNAGAGMGSGAKTDDLRARVDGPVILVGGAMMEGDVNRHEIVQFSR